MRICYVATTVHLSSDLKEGIGATTHTLAVASELAKLGHELFIISERFENDPEREKINGLSIFRLKRGVVKSSRQVKKSPFRKILKYLRFLPNFLLALQTARLIKENKCDLILERGHSRGVGAMASFMTGKPFVLEVIDPIFAKISAYRAEKIIAYTKDFFGSKIKHKVTLVDAGFDPKIFSAVPAEKKYDVVYAGSFKEWDGLEDLISATLEITRIRPRISFLLVGEGERFEKIKKMIGDAKLEKNFTLAGKVQLPEVKNFLSQGKIGVAPFNVTLSEKGNFNRYGFYFSPLKIFEYLACGLPIVASDYPLIKKIVSEKSGTLFMAGDSGRLAKIILGLLADPEKMAALSRRNLTLAPSYTWEKVVRKINDCLIEN